MKKHIHGVKISEVKEIGNTGGLPNRAYFSITYKDNSKEKFIIITNDNTSFKELRKIKSEIYKAFNEYNNIPESYLL